MLYFGLFIVGVLVFFALPGKRTTKKAKPAKKKGVQKEPGQHQKEDCFQFDLDAGHVVLSETRPAALSSPEVKKKYMQGLNDIPALPTIWPDVMRAIEHGDAARKVASLIMNEPTLALEVLRYANMVSPKDVSDLGQAIVLLGYNSVRGIVTRHCFSHMKSKGKSVYKSADLWRHAIATSALASIAAKYISGCDTGVAGTLGLLHDLGRIAINVSFTGQAVVKPHVSTGYLQVERESFGIHHLEAGILLAKHWHLPPAIQQGILYHHHPAFAPPDKIPEDIRKEVLAVYLADLLAIHFNVAGGHCLASLPQSAYASLMNASLKDIAADPQVSKELSRVRAMTF